jgi:retron-type reverse transcriptase
MRRRRTRQTLNTQEVPGPTPPYPFAKFSRRFGHYLDLTGDGDAERLAAFGLPQFCTPAELAGWLDVRLGTLAWLVHRFHEKQHPDNERQAHYSFRWIRKRSGGWRLIEAPKPILKGAQQQILEEILNRVRPHQAAHGFIKGRSIITNAAPHTGQRVLVKLDLENFYANITFSRVVAIFRGLGYCREAAIWLARLTTSAVPKNIPFPGGEPAAIRPFLPRHLPQGAPTSPALANLSAYVLDVRLSGLARAFGARYTRYADDLTFSGGPELLGRLRVFLPLVTRIVRAERFRVNVRKRRVVRNNTRQTVTGVVVNEGVNVSRREYDRLKATLHNCLRHGPLSQNRENHDDFAAHLRGRVAHVTSLNARRGAKLLALYKQIRW